MFDKNDMSIYKKKPTASGTLDEFMEKRKNNLYNNSVLNSTAFSECKSSLGIDSISSSFNKSQNNANYNLFNKFKSKSITAKFRDEIYLTNNAKQNQLQQKENLMNEQVDILNYRYKDTSTNNYILNILPRFKNIYKFNKKVQDYFHGDTIKISSRINVENKKLDFQDYIKYRNNDK